MKLHRCSTFALALALLGSTAALTAQNYGSPQGPPPGYGARAWDAPPEEFRDVQRQGFHDGVEGARHDVDNHRRPDVNNRDEFRRPHVPPSLRRDYREGFRRGYDVAMRHMLGAQPRPY